MQNQQEFVNGKAKQTFKKHGHVYTRKGYDVRVDTAERFKKKCDLLGEHESRIVEKLVESFTYATGWGEQVKKAEFEPRAEYHVKDAVNSVSGLFNWFRQ